jgi:ribosomal protein L12E/L44/L45/RPP1/RPP2
MERQSAFSFEIAKELAAAAAKKKKQQKEEEEKEEEDNNQSDRDVSLLVVLHYKEEL